MILFGAGKLIAVPTTDAAGNAIAVPTPVAVAVLQDVSVDIDYETKTLHGEKQFAVAVARGKAKIGWKAKTGDFDAGVLGSLLLGAQPAASPSDKAVACRPARTKVSARGVRTTAAGGARLAPRAVDASVRAAECAPDRRCRIGCNRSMRAANPAHFRGR